MQGIQVDPDARTVRAAGRRHLGRARPRDAGVRPRRHRRPRVDHRHRRLHARRRHRLADAQARARLRQPDLRRRRHRRRPARAPPAPTRTRSCSGACAAAAATSASSPSFEYRAAPGRPDRRWAARSSTRASGAARSCASTATACEDAPDELTTLVNLLTAPPAPFLPEEWHGKRGRDRARPATPARSRTASSAMRPLRELGEPVADLMGPMPYVAMQSLLDALWGPGRPQLHEGRLRCAGSTTARSRRWSLPPRRDARRASEIHVHHFGGAVARVPAGATAYGERRRRSC